MLASVSIGLPSFAKVVLSFDKLPEEIQDLHDGLPVAIGKVEMRLLHISSVLKWSSLKVYEDIEPKDFLAI